MRLSNVSRDATEKIRKGNTKMLADLLKEEFRLVQREILEVPLEKVEGLRGSAKTLNKIINLLDY